MVYNAASGNTHLLTPIAAEVLKILEIQPLSVRDIAQRLALSANVSVDEEITRQVANLIVSLDDLGLIDPAA